MAPQENHPGRWSRPLRLLHLLLAISVTAQLILGGVMDGPRPGRPESASFEIHEVLGFSILALIILHWWWSFTHPAEGVHHLFPWTRAGLRNVFRDFWRSVRHLRLPAGKPGEEGNLAGFTHGLGLLAITAVAVSGGLFFILRLSGASRVLLHDVAELHGDVAVLAWTYWGGHLGVTVLHSLLRHPTFTQMFSLRD